MRYPDFAAVRLSVSPRDWGLESSLEKSSDKLRLLGLGNTEEEVDYCLETLVPAANKLLEMSPFYKG